MQITVIGWNFRNTPIEVRERLALSRDQQIKLATRLKESFKLGGIVILSTCNRTEFFFAPAHIQKRIGDWGYEGYSEKTNIFMAARALQSKDWMQVKEISGLEEFIKTYEEVVAGNINPNEGIIVLI